MATRKSASDEGGTPSELIDAKIEQLGDSLDGNTRRAIDFREGDQIDEEALKALIRAAVTLNASSAARRRRTPPALGG